MTDKKDPKFWASVVKLVVWVVLLIGLIGLGLYYTAKFNTYQAPSSTSGPTDWGITRDSPIRSNR